MTIHTHPAAFDSIKRSLVALRMPRALEMLDATLRRVEQGDMTWVDALDNQPPRQHGAAHVAPDHGEDARRIRLRLPALARP
jgi:hypothetical protein